MTENEFLVQDLEPQAVWRYFAQISNIPRLSYQEKPARDWVIGLIEGHGLSYKQDNYGNLVVYKPAQNSASQSVVCLQAHLDMVPATDLGVQHDFGKDSIELELKEGFVCAKGTTLGADDGIGVATILAILTEDKISHPPLEVLFTVEEEVGLGGVNHLDKSLLAPDCIINLDYHMINPDEGLVCVGSAGGRSVEATLSLQQTDLQKAGELWQLSVRGLPGGHSGADIDKNHPNAIQLLVTILQDFALETGIQLASLWGGDADNAIPPSAGAIFLVNSAERIGSNNELEERNSKLKLIIKECRDVYSKLYPDFKLHLRSLEEGAVMPVWSESDSQRILQLLSTIPSGVLALSQSVPGLVQTSNNLGVARSDGGCLKLETMARSDNNKELYEVTRDLVNLYCLAMGHGSNKRINQVKSQKLEWPDLEIEVSDKVEGWQANPNSSLAKKYTQVYKKTTGKPVKIEAIHAGLECGKLVSYYPEAEAISIGPELHDIHTTRERVGIASVEEFWEVLKKVLESL